jgi:hypothetical protein
MSEIATTELPANPAWAMRGVYVFSCIFACIVDVALEGQTRTIRYYLRRLERWIKKLPIRVVMRWHINFVSRKLEAALWKKHPDWICFIAGYLITAALCAHSIITYIPAMRNQIFVPPESLPASALLTPIPANILGGLMLVLA